MGHVGRWGGPRPSVPPPVPALCLRGPRRPLAPPAQARWPGCELRLSAPPGGRGGPLPAGLPIDVALTFATGRALRGPEPWRQGPPAFRRFWVPLPLCVPRPRGRLGLASWGKGGPGAGPALRAVGVCRPAEISAARGRAAPAAHPGVRKPRPAARLSRAKHGRESEQGRAVVPRRTRRSFSTHAPGARASGGGVAGASVAVGGTLVPPSRWSPSTPCCPPALGRRLLL